MRGGITYIESDPVRVEFLYQAQFTRAARRSGLEYTDHRVRLNLNLARDQGILKPYAWLETTVISLKGEEQSRQLHRGYHGAARSSRLRRGKWRTP